MEVRTLARCLRSRQASSPLYVQQSGLSSRSRQITAPFSSQIRIPGAQSIRYASGNASSPPPSSSETTASSSGPQATETGNTPQNTSPTNKTSKPPGNIEEFSQLLDKLDFANQNAAQTTKTLLESQKEDHAVNRTLPPRSRGSDPLSLSRAVGQSAETDNYRTPIRRVELKLGPELGRQVHVDPDRGVDLAAALRTLQISCAVNRVRGQSHYQKFHVRRGQRTKDQRRERWRKLFKFSFQKTVSKIEKMRAQGW